MSSRTVTRHDRDLELVTARVYQRSEKRNRETEREKNRQSLRDRIGVEPPPRTLREKIMAHTSPPERETGFDVVKELRKYREKRERRQRVRHSS